MSGGKANTFDNDQAGVVGQRGVPERDGAHNWHEVHEHKEIVVAYVRCARGRLPDQADDAHVP